MARVLLLSGKLMEIQISNVHRKGVSLQNHLLVHFDDNSPAPKNAPSAILEGKSWFQPLFFRGELLKLRGCKRTSMKSVDTGLPHKSADPSRRVVAIILCKIQTVANIQNPRSKIQNPKSKRPRLGLPQKERILRQSKI